MYAKTLPVWWKEVDNLSEKRKDSKGRVLRTGESERKDWLYQYRHEDIGGKRQTIYDRDLIEQRKKEIQKQLEEGVSFLDGCKPLCDVLDRAYSLKCMWRASTWETIMRYLCLIKPIKLYNMPINRIRMTDCKQFLTDLHNEGKAFEQWILSISFWKWHSNWLVKTMHWRGIPGHFRLSPLLRMTRPRYRHWPRSLYG